LKSSTERTDGSLIAYSHLIEKAIQGGGTASIDSRIVCQSVSCRCGNAIIAGTRHLVIRNVDEMLSATLGIQSFCSLNCVRAYLLETIEMQDSIGSPESEELAIELHAVLKGIDRL
jgi:hypothetical protein